MNLNGDIDIDMKMKMTIFIVMLFSYKINFRNIWRKSKKSGFYAVVWHNEGLPLHQI